MNRSAVDPIADAVLYEGYILYPYRPSVKNRQRWTFGGLYPAAWCRAGSGDASACQTECLVSGGPATRFEAVVRFLHLTARQPAEVAPPLAEWPAGAEPPLRPVEALRVGGRLFPTWQEAEPREVPLEEVALGELAAHPRQRPFALPGGRRVETVRGEGGQIVGALVREQRPVEGVVEAGAREVGDGLYRVALRVANRTSLAGAGEPGRDEVLLHALVSTHALLGVSGGEFVSLLDPPERWREAASGCRNVGTWPVLAGEERRRDTMLSSPIILYDYPQVAPESPGDFFDGTEIDEILTLRIMTMTDEEKREMAAVDERAGALLARTEAMAREQLLGLHGTVRGLRPVQEEAPRG
jgi:hydrogenase maturation protease